MNFLFKFIDVSGCIIGFIIIVIHDVSHVIKNKIVRKFFSVAKRILNKSDQFVLIEHHSAAIRIVW